MLHHFGVAGLRSFLRRLQMWRMPWGWGLVLVLGLPLVMYAGAALKGTIGAPFLFDPCWMLLPALLTTLLIGPVEEIGWRGLARPLMERHLGPFWAGLWLGMIWALWHVPAFFLSGIPQNQWSLPGFFVGCVVLSLILTLMFNAAHGSLLVAALFHFQLNGPAWPNDQPRDSVIFTVRAAVIVVFNRAQDFDRNAVATEVLTSSAKVDRLPGPRHGKI